MQQYVHQFHLLRQNEYNTAYHLKLIFLLISPHLNETIMNYKCHKFPQLNVCRIRDICSRKHMHTHTHAHTTRTYTHIHTYTEKHTRTHTHMQTHAHTPASRDFANASISPYIPPEHAHTPLHNKGNYQCNLYYTIKEINTNFDFFVLISLTVNTFTEQKYRFFKSIPSPSCPSSFDSAILKYIN